MYVFVDDFPMFPTASLQFTWEEAADHFPGVDGKSLREAAQGGEFDIAVMVLNRPS